MREPLCVSRLIERFLKVRGGGGAVGGFDARVERSCGKLEFWRMFMGGLFFFR